VQQQIPFGNDRKKSKGNGRWAFVVGVGWQEQVQQQIPFGNDRKKSEGGWAFVVPTLDPRAGSRMGHPQISFGNDRQKSKGRSGCFASLRMTVRG
jgi:hypothetical protein